MKYNYKRPSTKTVNLAGGEAYRESPKLELVSLLLTSFVQDQFYRSKNESIEKVKELIPVVEKDFVAKAALYARNEFGMRSISHVVTAELFRKPEGGENYLYGLPWAKDFVKKVIRRPDDATEILAYYTKNVMKKALPKQLKLGLAEALQKFDEYQLAKYKGEGKAFKLVDIANLTHPKASPALNKLMHDKLKSAETWEVKMTQAGQKAETEEDKKELKADAWRELFDSGKMPYFALLRNLRNIVQQAPDLVGEVCELLTNETMIKKSLVLPFRFTTAYDELEKVQDVDAKLIRQILGALDEAVEISCNNVPNMDGETLVVLDGSGSMQGQPARIGSLFSSVLVKANNADFVTFDTRAKYVNFNPRDSVMTIARHLEDSLEGGGTDFKCIFPILSKAYDRIIILSDMQGWVGYDSPKKEFHAYEAIYDVSPYIYSFDLAGHGSLQFPENRVAAIAGFSDKVFDLMKLLEQDKQALVHKIEEVVL